MNATELTQRLQPVVRLHTGTALVSADRSHRIRPGTVYARTGPSRGEVTVWQSDNAGRRLFVTIDELAAALTPKEPNE